MSAGPSRNADNRSSRASLILEALEPRLLLSAFDELAGGLTDAAGGPFPGQELAWAGYTMVLPRDAGGGTTTLISGVPAYLWEHGCGPTSVGMVLGYWDTQGYAAFFVGDASTETADVDEGIASTEHYDDYCLPMDDTTPSILTDLSELGGAHSPHNSIADWMHTSWSLDGNRYGWTWFSAIDDAFDDYAEAVGYPDATASNELWGAFTWDDLVAEIDAGRPMVFLVDTNGDGSTDHFVPVIGYDTDTLRYACLNTWDTEVHWYDFAQIAEGQPWGIYGATSFDPNPPAEVPGDTMATALVTGHDGSSQTLSYSYEIGDGDWGTRDVDIYEVYLDEAGDVLIADVDAQAIGSSLDPMLRVFDSTGTEVAWNDDSTGLDSYISYTAPEAGTYYVGVSGYSNDEYDPSTAGSGVAGSTGVYDLLLEVQDVVPGEIHGTVWNDLNEDGVYDTGEPGLAGWQVFLDLDHDGAYDSGAEPVVTTDSNGDYVFTDISPGTYDVVQIVPAGWDQTYPGPGITGITADFAGFSNTGWEPPDPIAAAGPDSLLAMVNSNIGIWTQAGTLLASATLGTFFGSVTSGLFGPFDPWCFYDTYSDRYIVMAEEVEDTPGGNEAYALIAISATSSPDDLDTAPGDTDTDWYFYSIPMVYNFGTGLAWLDYPKIAADADSLYITGNYFSFASDAFQGVRVTRLDKTPMLSGTLGTRVDVVAPGGTTLQPAQSVGRDASDPQIFVSAQSNAIAVWEMDDSNVLTLVTSLAAPYSTYGGGAPQPGTTSTLDTLSSRLMNAVWRDDSVWTTHTVSVGGDATVRWYEIDTTGGSYSIVQQGDIDPGTDIHTFMPAITVDAEGNMGITYTQSSATQYAAMMYTGRDASDPAGYTSPGMVVMAGAAAYQSSGGIERWGDYGGIALDPADAHTFWAFHEYPVGAYSWGTWWGSFTFDPTGPRAHYVSVAAGEVVTGVDFGDCTGDLLVDDGDGGYMDSGWSLGANAGGYMGDYRFSAPGTGDEWATWTFGDLPTGDYQVYARWVAHPNRATNAAFEMLDGSTSEATAVVNQQMEPDDLLWGGYAWESLGVVHVDNGTLTVELTDAADGYVIADAVRLAADPELVIWDAQVFEGDSGTTALSFSVSLSRSSLDTVTVDWTTVDGTATSGADFTADSGTVTFTPGAVTQTIVIDVTGDVDPEGDETFSVVLSNPSNAAVANGTATGTILDDDGLVIDDGDSRYSDSGWATGANPGGYLDDYRYAPPGTGTQWAEWSFSDLPAGSYELYATWVTGNNRATDATYEVSDGGGSLGSAGVNQGILPSGLSFDDHEWTSLGVFDVTDGTLTVRLTDLADGYVVADGVCLVPAQPRVSIADAAVVEGDSGTEQMAFSVELSASSSGTVTVDWATSDGTATAGSDYTADSGTVTFLAGSTSETVYVDVLGDLDPEGPETFYVTLSNASGALIDDGEAEGLIVDNDTIRVVDDGDPVVYSDTGWSLGSQSGGYLGDYRFMPAGTGENNANWYFDGLGEGSYEVLVTWVPHANRATDAAFELFDGTTSVGVAQVDQTAAPHYVEWDGAWWYSLGVVTTSTGEIAVQLTDDADGFVVADAVHLRPVQGAATTEVDDGDLGYMDTNWRLGNQTGGRNGDYRYANAGDGSEYAEWMFDGVADGDYQIYVTWVEHANRASDATFEFFDGPATAGSATLDQRQAPADMLWDGTWWADAGTVSLSSGTLTVQLTDLADGFVIADAVRIVRDPGDSLGEAMATGHTGADMTFSFSGGIGDGYQDLLDVDVFQVTVDETGDTIIVDVNASTAGSTLDSVVRIFDDAGVELASNDDSGGPDSYLEFSVPEAGTYYVGISGAGNAAYDATSAGSGAVGSTGYYDVDIEVVDALPAEIHGVKWSDVDDDGVRDGGEPGVEGWVIFLDDGDGILEPGEEWTTTDATGAYSFTDLSPGSYIVAEEQQTGWDQTYPEAGSWSVTLSSGEVLNDVDFGNHYTVVAMVIDDGDAGFSTTGVWNTESLGYQGDHHYTFPAPDEAIATWTFSSLASGQYEVYVTYVDHVNRSSSASYQVRDGGALEGNYSINQTAAPNDLTWDGVGWESLGTFTITSGTLSVRLSRSMTGLVSADAVRIVAVGSTSPDPAYAAASADVGGATVSEAVEATSPAAAWTEAQFGGYAAVTAGRAEVLQGLASGMLSRLGPAVVRSREATYGAPSAGGAQPGGFGSVVDWRAALRPYWSTAERTPVGSEGETATWAGWFGTSGLASLFEQFPAGTLLGR